MDPSNSHCIPKDCTWPFYLSGLQTNSRITTCQKFVISQSVASKVPEIWEILVEIWEIIEKKVRLIRKKHQSREEIENSNVKTLMEKGRVQLTDHLLQ